MKKTVTSKSPSAIREDLLPEYNFDYRKAKPNRFAGRKVDRVVVALDPDVAKVFQTQDTFVPKSTMREKGRLRMAASPSFSPLFSSSCTQ